MQWPTTHRSVLYTTQPSIEHTHTTEYIKFRPLYMYCTVHILNFCTTCMQSKWTKSGDAQVVVIPPTHHDRLHGYLLLGLLLFSFDLLKPLLLSSLHFSVSLLPLSLLPGPSLLLTPSLLLFTLPLLLFLVDLFPRAHQLSQFSRLNLSSFVRQLQLLKNEYSQITN